MNEFWDMLDTLETDYFCLTIEEENTIPREVIKIKMLHQIKKLTSLITTDGDPRYVEIKEKDSDKVSKYFFGNTSQPFEVEKLKK